MARYDEEETVSMPYRLGIYNSSFNGIVPRGPHFSNQNISKSRSVSS